jgi:hypothetical protein
MNLALRVLSLESTDRDRLTRALHADSKQPTPSATRLPTGYKLKSAPQSRSGARKSVMVSPRNFVVYNYDDLDLDLPEVMQLRVSVHGVKVFDASEVGAGFLLKEWDWTAVVSYKGFCDESRPDHMEFFMLDVGMRSALVFECENADEIRSAFCARVRLQSA